jgi:hypothetical protein
MLRPKWGRCEVHMNAETKERRKNVRQKSFLQGRIYYNNRRSSLDCLVRDISEQGARLRFSEAVTIPDALELYIPNRNETRRARIQWRLNDEVGVEFCDEHVAAPASQGDLEARVHRLENDVATLQRKVRELMNALAERRSTSI